MTTQPKAQRLADELEDMTCLWSPSVNRARVDKAATELRRLSAVEAQRNALLEALKAMLHRDERNTCRHEETHRGGALWEICDSCGAMWADDEGGKPEWEDPKEWAQARAAIKAAEGEKT